MFIRVCLFIFLFKFCNSLYRQSNIILKDNGYSNVLLAIHDSVTDETILNKIKTDFTKASEFLYSATRKRTYFKEIIILVPNSWKDAPGITPAAVGQTIQNADIVLSGPRPSHRNYPYTRAYAGCGHPGIHIQMTADMFLNSSNPPVNGKLDKLIVHEWANFRWGVFNEYPSPGENQFYYSTVYGRPDPVRCSLGLVGRVLKRFSNGTSRLCDIKTPDPMTGLVEEGCYYLPYPYHNSGTESLMDHPHIQEITDFCDDRRDFPNKKFGHNNEPPNKQNILCSYRSTWDVIENTDDFLNGQNQPRDISKSYLMPTFKIVKAQRTKRATIYIDDDNLESNQLLDHVIGKIHSNTAIMLRHPNPHTGQHIVKRAAKTENKRITLHTDTLLESLISKEHASSAHQLIVISCNKTLNLPTESIYFLGCKGKGPNTRHVTSIFELSNFLHNKGKDTVHISHKALHLKDGRIHQDTFIVDEYLDGKLSIRITYTDDIVPHVHLHSPSGPVTNISTSVDYILKVVTINVEKPEKGKWDITVSTKNSKRNDLEIFISSTTAGPVPITISAKAIGRYYHGEQRVAVFAEVSLGHHPVLGLKVTATVQTGVTNGFHTDLYDNGSGADIQRDDGIYSRYMPYYQDEPNPKIVIEVSDPLHSGHVMKTHLIAGNDIGDYEYKFTKIPLRHGVSRVTAVHPYFNHVVRRSVSNGIPPARIQNLRLLSVSADKSISLEFTAVGEDLDHGTAHHYELYYAHTSRDILDNKDALKWVKRVQQKHLISGSIQFPRPSGYTEVFRINSTALAPNKRSFAFVILAVDKDGNKGEMSNMVTAGFLS